MFVPDPGTKIVVDRLHAERLDHAARIRLVRRERGPLGIPTDKDAPRRAAARRLADAGGRLLTGLVSGAAAATRRSGGRASMGHGGLDPVR